LPLPCDLKIYSIPVTIPTIIPGTLDHHLQAQFLLFLRIRAIQFNKDKKTDSKNLSEESLLLITSRHSNFQSLVEHSLEHEGDYIYRDYDAELYFPKYVMCTAESTSSLSV